MSDAEGLRWGLTLASLIFSAVAMGHGIGTRRQAVSRARRKAALETLKLIRPLWQRVMVLEDIERNGSGPRLAQDTSGRDTA